MLGLLRIMFLSLSMTAPIVLHALKLDDTHYRFCVMDDATITNYSAEYADNANSLPHFTNSYWYSYNGVKIDGTDLSKSCSNAIKSIKVLMSNVYSGSKSSIVHHWGMGYNGVVYDQTTYFYIEVNAPTGIMLSKVPSKMLIDEEAMLSPSLLGSYTSYSGNGYFDLKYSSSNESIVSVSSGKIRAHKAGKATIKIEAYAKNKVYSGSYYIGSASYVIEVEDISPNRIQLDYTDLKLKIGEDKTVSAIVYPANAATTISWTSSDNNIATVKDGNICGVGRGQCVIEAKTSNGLSAPCKVTVEATELQAGESFEYNGLYYTVIDPTQKTCKTREGSDKGGFKPGQNTNLSFIEIPATVFYETIPYKVISIGAESFMYSNAESIVLPATLETIDNFAFTGSEIYEVNLPESLKSIGRFAFNSCHNLETVNINESIEVLSWGVFTNCPNLKLVYYLSDSPISGDKDAFDQSAYDNAILYVKASALAKIKNTEPWCEFNKIAIDAKTAGSIKEIYSFGPETNVLIDFPMTVTYVNGYNCYTVDSNGSSTLIYGSNDYTDGDIIPGRWLGTYTMYNGLPEIKPLTDLPMAERKGSFTPMILDLVDVTDYLINKIVVVRNVKFNSATPFRDSSNGPQNFEGTNLDGTVSRKFRTNFEIESVEEGVYDVKAAVSVYYGEIELFPIEYKESDDSGIDDVYADKKEAQYYDLFGNKISAEELVKGIYIKKVGGEVTKIAVGQ